VSDPAVSPRIRPALAQLPAYKAGTRPAASDGDTARLASNETSDGPLPGVLDAIADVALQSHRYPDPGATALIEAIAAFHHVPADHVAVGTGSVALGAQLVAATAEHGDEVIYAWRSFEAYPIFVALAGASSVQIPVTPAGEHDLQAMLKAIVPDTRAVIICTPNNPTGTVVSQPGLRRFCEAVPADVLVVIDEAYQEFVTAADAGDGLAAYRDFANVCVLRTFSKAYGLAGLRVGYAIAHGPVIEALQRTAVPFGVSAPAQAAAVASLTSADELAPRVARVVAERRRVLFALHDMGWKIPPAEGNFVWLPTGADTDAFEQTCRAARILVRAFPGEGCRVTIGTTSENDRFLEVVARWTAGGRPRSATPAHRPKHTPVGDPNS